MCSPPLPFAPYSSFFIQGSIANEYKEKFELPAVPHDHPNPKGAIVHFVPGEWETLLYIFSFAASNPGANSFHRFVRQLCSRALTEHFDTAPLSTSHKGQLITLCKGLLPTTQYSERSAYRIHPFMTRPVLLLLYYLIRNSAIMPKVQKGIWLRDMRDEG